MLAVSLALPKGYKLNEESPMTYLLETPDKEGILSSELSPSGEKVSPPKTQFKITVPLARAVSAGEKFDLKVSLLTLICSEPSSLCRPKSFIWNVPITISDSTPTPCEPRRVLVGPRGRRGVPRLGSTRRRAER